MQCTDVIICLRGAHIDADFWHFALNARSLFENSNWTSPAAMAAMSALRLFINLSCTAAIVCGMSRYNRFLLGVLARSVDFVFIASSCLFYLVVSFLQLGNETRLELERLNFGDSTYLPAVRDMMHASDYLFDMLSVLFIFTFDALPELRQRGRVAIVACVPHR